jgi:hypothetical protein
MTSPKKKRLPGHRPVANEFEKGFISYAPIQHISVRVIWRDPTIISRHCSFFKVPEHAYRLFLLYRNEKGFNLSKKPDTLMQNGAGGHRKPKIEIYGFILNSIIQ